MLYNGREKKILNLMKDSNFLSEASKIVDSDAMINIFKKNGIDISKEEANEILSSAKNEKKNLENLSDGDLDAIIGGGGGYIYSPMSPSSTTTTTTTVTTTTTSPQYRQATPGETVAAGAIFTALGILIMATGVNDMRRKKRR